ncbi:MmcQ/YjbR family DNA-binding protein [Isoptericola sp. F-RaC21]|uniref:MmcQ/YjbR family DNA-binding protein n=1 Tax=Isoptericola sp. F-RaC21 TaxID=3141452 RepID=UPI00315B4C84
MGPTQHQDLAAEVALALPGTTRTWPFGPEHDVFKVQGKVFCMTTDATGTPLVTLKCAPDDAEALRQEHAHVTAGYHMNKRHWISVAAGPGITPELVEELVLDAYALVVASLPRRLRPVDLDDTERLRTGVRDVLDGGPTARPGT